MKLFGKSLRIASFLGRTQKNDNACGAFVSPHIAGTVIGQALAQRSAFLASRLGWFEAYSIGHYDASGRITEGIRKKMWNTPGIFPDSEEQFAAFRAEYTRCIGSVDLLGLMECPNEDAVVARYAPRALRCRLQDLEPYYQPIPWSKHLAGLKVLVIHPFAESIERQYRSSRERLFLDADVLPRFELSTLRSPQTLCGNTDGFASWNDALADLRDKVARLEFDAAIIGSGAYGLPIGAFVKSLGRTAIHLGGATQALFGIIGSRWTQPGQPMRFLINSHWVRPMASERPANWKQAEEGCYW